MIIIGEKINATLKPVREALINKDVEFLQQLARAQVVSGADYLDVNVATGGADEDEIAQMKWIVELIQEVVDKPLVIDSADPEVLEAGVKQHKGPVPMLNSVNAEEEKLVSVLPLAKEFGTPVIALAMDEKGIPKGVRERIATCEKILDRSRSYGIPIEHIFLDPLVMPVATDTTQGNVTLETLRQIKAKFKGVKTTLGLSNISFGLPLRNILNRTCLLMAMSLGLDSVITDPLDTKLMSVVKAAEVVLGRDNHCIKYIKAYRKGTIKV